MHIICIYIYINPHIINISHYYLTVLATEGVSFVVFVSAGSLFLCGHLTSNGLLHQTFLGEDV